MSMSEKPSLTAVRVWLSSDDFLVLAEVFKSLPGTPATTLLAPVGQRVARVRSAVGLVRIVAHWLR
jgi:chromate transport protein ChrA